MDLSFKEVEEPRVKEQKGFYYGDKYEVWVDNERSRLVVSGRDNPVIRGIIDEVKHVDFVFGEPRGEVIEEFEVSRFKPWDIYT